MTTQEDFLENKSEKVSFLIFNRTFLILIFKILYSIISIPNFEKEKNMFEYLFIDLIMLNN